MRKASASLTFTVSRCMKTRIAKMQSTRLSLRTLMVSVSKRIAISPSLNSLVRSVYVLANTLQLRGWDGRFSRDNKAWAEHFSIPGDPATGGEHRFLFQCESHPAVLDGFISLTRRELEKQKSSVLDLLKSAASPSRDLPQSRKGIER